MCNYCNQDTCPSGCPNSEQLTQCFKCSECGEWIFEHDEYFDIDGIIICEHCIDDFKKTAECDENRFYD